MRFKHLIAMISAATVAVSPVAAAVNPAQSLSVTKAARASAPTEKTSKLGGGAGVAGFVIGAGVLAIIAIAIVNSDDDDGSDSN